jgi:hypothetical protein
METLQAKIADFKARIIFAFAANPQKAWLLTLLSTVFLVLIGRLSFKTSPVPAVRAAQISANVSPQDDDRSGNSSVGPAVPLAQWAHEPIEPVGRNLFCIPLDYYPYPDGAHSQDGGDGLWDQLAKSMSTQADARREHLALVDNLRTEAADLKLQGTVLGTIPKAWINGSLVQLGQMIGTSGFRLMQIESRRIVVEREGVRLSIEMN